MIDLSYKPDRKPEKEEWKPEEIAIAVTAVVLWSVYVILFFAGGM